MAEQGDLFAPGVAEAPRSVLMPADPARDLQDRFVAYGLAALDEGDALALVLGRCLVPGADAVGAANALMARFGAIGRVLGAPEIDVARVIGAPAARQLGLLHALLLRALEYPLRQRSVLTSYQAVKAYLQARLTALPREAFHVLFLDKKNQLIADELMNEGTVDHVPVYPREVARRALEFSASAVILVHNHPSGDPRPSQADINMTHEIVDALRALSITVHDHLVIGSNGHASFKALGIL